MFTEYHVVETFV